MLILEATGTFDPQSIQSLLKSDETFECIPYAALGDFSLRIHIQKDSLRADEILDGLEAQGYAVVGYRWKKEVREVATPRPAFKPEVQSAPEPWYTRLFGARKRPLTH
ncbi:hypothetical protein [Deinococcus roseus]|uniref:HMA domain-containing protein n=1 Tax=Deinococcus roseus TaxID=392414 RepID=A0ABQ2DBV1_9DEIO|nr:hypothetical protein [Deinococcus roseus]GGJ51753.1 hypothetical protein GCM10008938_42240 [Deinococcus roseus]